jgi:hypothetical protein
LRLHVPGFVVADPALGTNIIPVGHTRAMYIAFSASRSYGRDAEASREAGFNE